MQNDTTVFRIREYLSAKGEKGYCTITEKNLGEDELRPFLSVFLW